MTDPVERPAPIQERVASEMPLRKTVVHKHEGDWIVYWGHWWGKRFMTFPEAIRFATQDREIGACS